MTNYNRYNGNNKSTGNAYKGKTKPRRLNKKPNRRRHRRHKDHYEDDKECQ